MTEVGADPAAERPRSQLLTGWVARMVAEGSTAVLALVTGAVVARHLGVAGKGAVSTVGYLVSLCAIVGSLGFGEALVTAIGYHREDPSHATSASLTALSASAGILAVFAYVATLVVMPSTPGEHTTAVAAAVTVVALIGVKVGLLALDANSRIVLASMLRVGSALLTTVATVVLVLGLERAVAGAVVAPGLGAAATAAAGLLALRFTGIRLWPVVDVAYVRRAARIGLPVMASILAISLAARVDLFLVLAVGGRADAGLYSVALTMSQLAAYPADTLVSVAYPRLASIDEPDYVTFVGALVRVTIAAVALTAVVLAVVMPFGVPLAFGSTFRGSVAPATALFGSVLLYSSQTILVRAEAARGRSVLSAWSYGASVVVMITLDALLIPGMGITGAVLASTVGQATGFVIAATTFGRHHAGWRARDLVPGRRDVATVRSLIGSYRRR